MKVDPVRLLALDLLVRADQGEPLDPLLDRALAGQADPRSASFLAELVRGTVQWRERYRHVLNSFVTRKLPEDPALRQLLFLSLHQLLGQDGVPAYAAIHQAGQLCRARVSDRQVAFVNGVLQAVRRQILGEDDTLDFAARESKLRPLFADIEADPVRWVATWHSHPGWLVKRWQERFGLETAEAICAANNRLVPLCFHVLEPAEPGDCINELALAGCSLVPGHEGRALTVEGRLGQQTLREILDRFPQLIVQDPAVQEATTWLMAGRGALTESPVWSNPDLSILDLCAAPGGKTTRLAAAWGKDHPLMAVDNRPQRIDLLRDTLQRTGYTWVQVVQADGLQPPVADGSCAAVLLDGPCSGTGVLRHHPEGRWRLQRKSPGRNGQVLLELAEKAADLLAPGGLLMYATCSLESQENEDVVASLLAGRQDLEPVPDDQGRWQRQWLPGAGPGDGFFAARLMKKY
jgi:16S rRNA (cytosine967-C5)-methyltransferase